MPVAKFNVWRNKTSLTTPKFYPCRIKPLQGQIGPWNSFRNPGSEKGYLNHHVFANDGVKAE